MSFTHQQKFIGIIKTLLPANLSLADELSHVLDISLDSAYRRIRGETALTLDEVVNLSHHFDVPLEALNQHIPNVVTFQFTKIADNAASFAEYMEKLLSDLRYVDTHEDKTIFYTAEDMPIFHNFSKPHLARFKLYYWLKSIQHDPSLENTRYSEDIVPEALMNTGKQIYEAYNRIPSVEIWTEETVTSTMKQVRFYWDAGFFSGTDDALKVCEDLKAVITDVQKQSEWGRKLGPTGNVTPYTYTLYISDLMIGSNSILVKTEGKTVGYLSYNSLNSMRTFNRFFNEQTETWINNLIRKSTLISNVAERQRNQFFKGILRKLQLLEEYIVNNG